MNKQQILFAKEETYKVRLPKIIKDVSLFEMQFGFKQPAHYRCRSGEVLIDGKETVSIPGYTDNVRI